MVFNESLGTFLMQGGFIMYPLYLVGGAVVVYGILAARGLRRTSGLPDVRLESSIDAVLFWGIFAVALGLLGTLLGIVQAAQAIELAGGAEARLVWAGIRVALTSTIFALLLFGVSGVAWFGLRTGYARRLR